MDIDIDFKTTFDPRQVIASAIPASMLKDGDLQKHPCGFYFQNIAVDSVTNLAAIPYESASKLGFFKIDFLHLSTLDKLQSKQEIRELIHKAPQWDLLLDPTVVAKLFQIHKHPQLVQKVKPTTVQQLADCIALIRPAKRHLINEYAVNPDKVRKVLYLRTEDGYYFKKSHAISYALTIVLQLHLIAQGRM